MDRSIDLNLITPIPLPSPRTARHSLNSPHLYMLPMLFSDAAWSAPHFQLLLLNDWPLAGNRKDSKCRKSNA